MRSALLIAFAVLLASRAAAGGPERRPTPEAVPGELIVRLAPEFPDCAHCVLEHGGSFTALTGRRNLDNLRQRFGVRAMEPLFGGLPPAQRRARLERRAGATAPPDLAQTYVVRVDRATDLGALAEAFRRDAAVASVEPNYVYRARAADDDGAGLPDDPFFASTGSWGQPFADLWPLFRIGAPAAWAHSTGAGVVVAVVDSGLDTAHPDLAANVWHNLGELPGNGLDDDQNGFVDDLTGWDFTQCEAVDRRGCLAKPRGPDVGDDNGHGTHLAGLIAAEGGNGLGMIGVAYDSRIMAVKGLRADGAGSAADLAAAIVYAAENGAQVINASWGGPPSDAVAQAVAYAVDAFDVVVVAASGNDNRPIEAGGSSPADLSAVIAVGATTEADARAATSNFGGPLDILAPGGGDLGPAESHPGLSMLSTLAAGSRLGQVCGEDTGCTAAPWVVADEYVRDAGTSMAAAVVSGVAALVRSRHPELSAGGVYQALRTAAVDLGPPGWDRQHGYGRVDALAAVTAPPGPVARILAPDNGAKLRDRDLPYTIRGVVAPGAAPIASWELTLAPTFGSEPPRRLAQGSTAIAGETLATVHEPLPVGGHELQLRVVGSDASEGIDRRLVFVPNQDYVSLPLPGRAASFPTIASDGSRIAYNVSRPRTDGASDTLVFDRSLRSHRIVTDALNPFFIPPNGDFVFYAYSDPVRRMSYLVLHDLLTDNLLADLLPLGRFFEPVMSAHAGRIAFTSNSDLDPRSLNGDGSFELFFRNIPSGPIQQITMISEFADRSPPSDLAMSLDGRLLTFSSRVDLDSTATTNGKTQVFLYDFLTSDMRQVTNRGTGSSDLPEAAAPQLSGDGRRLSFIGSEGLYLMDTESGSVSLVHRLDEVLLGSSYRLSGDGSSLVFISQADLDPRVMNEDRRPEIFRLDVQSGDVHQLSDYVGSPFSSPLGADAANDVMTHSHLGKVNGLNVAPVPALLQPRRPGANTQPILACPAQIVLAEGASTAIAVSAEDGDFDRLTLFAQFPDSLERTGSGLLQDFADSTFDDHGDGTATLTVAPRYNEAGQYSLIVAAFDGAGGIDECTTTIVVTDNLIEGDADCDGLLTQADRLSLVRHLFDHLAPMCHLADANDDGTVNAADLVSLTRKLGT